MIDPLNVAAGLGVPHTFELPAVWGTNSNAGGTGNSAYQTTNAVDIPLVMGYWISFVRSLNPNTFREEGSPEWDNFVVGSTQQRLLIQTNATQMETVPASQTERCNFWNGLALTMEQ